MPAILEPPAWRLAWLTRTAIEWRDATGSLPPVVDLQAAALALGVGQCSTGLVEHALADAGVSP